jgi:hypothetical protein
MREYDCESYYRFKGSGLTDDGLEERLWVNIFNLVGMEKVVSDLLQERKLKEQEIASKNIEVKQD